MVYLKGIHILGVILYYIRKQQTKLSYFYVQAEYLLYCFTQNPTKMAELLVFIYCIVYTISKRIE